MSFLWDSIKGTAASVGSAAGVASQKTKLYAEIMLIDREVRARQHTFGVVMYDHVAPLSKSPDFYASDDLLTATIRPPLILAQREISVLELKRGKLKEQIVQADVTRKATIAPAQNWQEVLMNAGKSTALAGNEAKLKTEGALLEHEVTYYKQTFGQSLFAAFEKLEDEQNWLPTNREIRNMYDVCRKDVEEIRKRRNAKSQELIDLGGEPPSNTEQQTFSNTSSHSLQPTTATASLYTNRPASAPVSGPLPSSFQTTPYPSVAAATTGFSDHTPSIAYSSGTAAVTGQSDNTPTYVYPSYGASNSMPIMPSQTTSGSSVDRFDAFAESSMSSSQPYGVSNQSTNMTFSQPALGANLSASGFAPHRQDATIAGNKPLGGGGDLFGGSHQSNGGDLFGTGAIAYAAPVRGPQNEAFSNGFSSTNGTVDWTQQADPFASLSRPNQASSKKDPNDLLW